MTKQELDKEIEALRVQMDEALAVYHRAAGALQFAEFVKSKEVSDGSAQHDVGSEPTRK